MSDWDDRHPHEPPDPSEGVRIIGPDEAAADPRRGDPRARFRSGQGQGRRDVPREVPPRPTMRFPRDERDEADEHDRDRPPVVPVERRDPQSDLSHWGDPGLGAAPNEEVPDMNRRDPYEGDEAAAWGTFAGTEPRWRDDDPNRDPRRGGYEPPPGRSVFGDDSPVSTETYEDSYRDQSYDDRGPSHVDQSSTDRGYEQPQPQPQPPRPGPPDPRYDQAYDDSYSDDVYQETPQVFVEPPQPPRQAGRSRPGRAPNQGGESDMRVRIAVGVGLAAAALVLFKLGPAPTMVLVVAVLGMASFEYFTATQRAGFDPLMPVGVVATVGAVIAAYHYGEPALPLVLVLSVAVCTIWYLIDAGGERPMANVGATLLGICWVGMFGAFAGLLLGGPHGIALLLAALVPTVGYDVGALFVGRSAGSRPLSAASPNKTLEGLVGGMVLAVVGGLLLAVFNIDPFDSLAEGLKIGLVAAVAAPLGDLSESLIKRDLGIKDMGTLLPGHGGVLDRFDALLFVLPAIWYMARVSDFFLT